MPQADSISVGQWQGPAHTGSHLGLVRQHSGEVGAEALVGNTAGPAFCPAEPQPACRSGWWQALGSLLVLVVWGEQAPHSGSQSNEGDLAPAGQVTHSPSLSPHVSSGGISKVSPPGLWGRCGRWQQCVWLVVGLESGGHTCAWVQVDVHVCMYVVSLL